MRVVYTRGMSNDQYALYLVSFDTEMSHQEYFRAYNALVTFQTITNKLEYLKKYFTLKDRTIQLLGYHYNVQGYPL